jgi:hypothetical protein
MAAKVPDLRKRLGDVEGSLANSRTILARTASDRDEIAAREHRGEITAEESTKQFAAVNEAERVHLSEVERLSRICSLIEREIAELENEAALAAHADAVDALESAQAAVVAASAIVAKQAAQLGSSVEKLERARVAAEAAATAADELYVDGAGELPVVDEGDWLGGDELAELVRVLTAGPVQPAAAHAAHSAAQAAAMARSDRETIELTVNGILHGSMTPEADIERLPERLRQPARDRIKSVSERRLRESGVPSPTDIGTSVLHRGRHKIAR